MSATLVETPPKYGTGTTPETPAVWGPVKKIGFRFLFCYLCLFGLLCLEIDRYLSRSSATEPVLPGPLDQVSGVLVSFVARHLFGLRDFTFQAVTSDSLSDYLRAFTYALISLVVTVVWSFRDRKATNYSRLNQWLRLYAQFILAVTLFAYGLSKVIPEQFHELTPSRLLAPGGDLTPFLVLWFFMAASKPYTIFTGFVELVAGVMLVTPKLKSIGALLAVAALTNVFALNVFYDVPVKLLALHLLLIAIYLASPEIPRLFDTLILNRRVEPGTEPLLAQNAAVVNWAQPIQSGLAVVALIGCLIGINRRHNAELAASRNAPLAGIWEVDDFKTGSSQPLFTTKLVDEMKSTVDHLRPEDDHWTKLIVEAPGQAVLQLQSGILDYVQLSIDKDLTQLEVSDSDDPAWKTHFTVHQPVKNLLYLQGLMNGVPVEITLHTREKGFRLTSEKVHLVQTYP